MQFNSIKDTLLLHSGGQICGIAYEIELKVCLTVWEGEVTRLTISNGDVEIYIWLLTQHFVGIPEGGRVSVAVMEGRSTEYARRPLLHVAIKQGGQFVPCFKSKEETETYRHNHPMG